MLEKFYLRAKIPLSKSMRAWTLAESVGMSESSGCEKGLLKTNWYLGLFVGLDLGLFIGLDTGQIAGSCTGILAQIT